ncbi:flagellar protein FliS [Pseudodesulfovibrio mercurii]|uniref:Flagellar protein FliS n=1 Tax=Pseudodesulfovibrio mercurii TaxID=641491 RepID=F0JL67_9BACT|nr:flagellar export chaperone FliS [Pseudodesulfovibrio mercurii]EGB16666.1 flagellar protein FliS [Pseudodesulfovibrio mercurii]
MANPAKAYLATQIETTTQGELLLMLYEAAIKFLKQAKREIDNRDYAKKGIYISKAMAIIHELSESLNKEKGGEITPKLGQLYMFCTTQLVKANIRLDNRMIDDVIKILDGLRSAYAQIVPIHDGKAAPGDTVSMGAPRPVAPPVPPAPPVMPAQVPPQQARPVQQAKPAAKPAAQPAPQPAAPVSPAPLRSGAAAAKFRAANAYNNANR